MAKELLITVSMGIVKDARGNYFMQLITAEQYNFYYVQLDKQQANQLSKNENVEITDFSDQTIEAGNGTDVLGI